MKCPACAKEMAEQNFGGVKVDICKNGCKGIWFDWLELQKLDEKNEGLGDALKEALASPRANVSNRPPLTCPACGIKMHPHIYPNTTDVTVDECYTCAGFFLDSGELKAIRDTFMTEQQEARYVQKMLDNNPGYQQAMQNLEKESARTEALRRMTRFLRLSYLITHK